MQTSSSDFSLEKILTLCSKSMQQLLMLLQDETAVLKTNDIPRLEDITLNKIAITEQVEKNEQSRIQFLSQHSLDPNQPGQWIKNAKLKSIWNELKDFASQCQKQNQINGLVINGYRNQVKTQIEILSTSSLPEADLVYSSAGEGVQQRKSKTLAHA